MARPKKEQRDARAVILGLRLTRDERALIASRAASCGVPVSDYARTAALGARVEARVASPALAAASTAQVVALNRVGVNLNQIAHKLNAGGLLAPDDLANTLARINALLDEWQDVAA